MTTVGTPLYGGLWATVALGACAGSVPVATDAGVEDGFDADSLDATPGDADLNAAARDADLDASRAPDGPDLGPARLEIGLGLVEHVPARDGDDAEVVRGPAGGLFLELTTRAFGVALGPEGLDLVIRGRDALTGEELTNPLSRRLTTRNTRVTSDGVLEGLGITLAFLETRCADRLVGRRMTLDASVLQPMGELLASDRVDLVLVDEEYVVGCPDE